MLQVVKWVAKQNTIITFWDFAGDIILYATALVVPYVA